MGVFTLHINSCSHFQKELFKSLIAYILLFLVSVSFIVEHIPFVESDILELIESNEKETKDNKLLLLSQNMLAISDMENGKNYICDVTNYPLKGVSIDIITPPPEFS